MNKKQTKMTDGQLRYFGYLCDKINTNWHYYDINEEGTCTLVCYWWNFPYDNYIEWLKEKVEVECRFEDEIDSCRECLKAIEITPSSYGWLPNYMADEEMIPVCRECIENDVFLQEEFIEILSNHDSHERPRAIIDWFRPISEEHGFKCLENDEMACERFETGFHPGQNDDPEEIKKWMEENLPDHEFLFCVDSVGQFDCTWSLLLRPKLEDEEEEQTQ